MVELLQGNQPEPFVLFMRIQPLSRYAQAALERDLTREKMGSSITVLEEIPGGGTASEAPCGPHWDTVCSDQAQGLESTSRASDWNVTVKKFVSFRASS